MFVSLLSLPDRVAARIARRPVLWQGIFATVLVLLLLFTSIRYAEKAITPSRDGTLTRTALLRWRPQIQALEHGENIYLTHNYPNPPIMAMVLWPFTELPPVTGGVLWLLLKAFMAVLMVLWTFRLCGPLPGPAKALIIVLGAHPLLGDLNHGNVNIFIVFLVVACLEAFRRGRDLTAGLALGLAIACKVTPALFLPYFGWKALRAAVMTSEDRLRAAWHSGGKVLAGAVLGLVLFLLVVPSAILALRTGGPVSQSVPSGWNENLTLLDSWFHVMVKPFLIDGQITSIHANQSIPGVVNRLLTHEPSDVDYDEDDGKMRSKEFHNFADIGPVAARRVVQGCQLGFVLMMMLLCRTNVSVQRSGLALTAEYGMIILGMLLFSERTWKHHSTGLVVPVAAIVGLWTLRPSGTKTRALILLLLLLVTELTLVPSFLGGRLQDLALTFGTHTAAFLLLLLAVGVVLWQTRHDGQAELPNPAVSP